MFGAALLLCAPGCIGTLGTPSPSSSSETSDASSDSGQTGDTDTILGGETYSGGDDAGVGTDSDTASNDGGDEEVISAGDAPAGSDADGDSSLDGDSVAYGDSDANPTLDAEAMAAAMGWGTNIGNTLENTTSWETGWGQPLITKAFIDGMADNGLKTVRLPVAWDTYAQNGVIADDKMARVKEVVEWILQADMFCIVNIHWDGGWIMNEGHESQYQLTDDVRSKFASYWQQIAAAFADVGHHLVLEAMNEEGRFFVNGDNSAGPDYAPLNELNQLFVDTVRGSGGYNETRNLLISGFATDIQNTAVADFGIPTDPAGAGRLLLSIHYYTPYTFCGLEEPANWYEDVWTYPATTWGTAEELAELQGLFGQLADFCTDRNIPAILGEFAVVLGKGEYVREQASRILWMKSVFETSVSHGMVPLLWDTGTEISRDDGSLSTELTQVMTELGW